VLFLAPTIAPAVRLFAGRFMPEPPNTFLTVL
jgi:hypothetical protein